MIFYEHIFNFRVALMKLGGKFYLIGMLKPSVTICLGRVRL